VVSYPKEIPPGGKGTITVAAATEDYDNRMMIADFTILTNDPLRPTIKLVMRGFVNSFYTFEPKRAILVGPLGVSVTAEMVIRGFEGLPFKVLDVIAPSDAAFASVIEENEDARGPFYRIRFSSTAREAMRYRQHVILKTDFEFSPELALEVYGDIFKPTISMDLFLE
jgi:hypothetical protein